MSDTDKPMNALPKIKDPLHSLKQTLTSSTMSAASRPSSGNASKLRGFIKQRNTSDRSNRLSKQTLDHRQSREKQGKNETQPVVDHGEDEKDREDGGDDENETEIRHSEEMVQVQKGVWHTLGEYLKLYTATVDEDGEVERNLENEHTSVENHKKLRKDLKSGLMKLNTLLFDQVSDIKTQRSKENKKTRKRPAESVSVDVADIMASNATEQELETDLSPGRMLGRKLSMTSDISATSSASTASTLSLTSQLSAVLHLHQGLNEEQLSSKQRMSNEGLLDRRQGSVPSLPRRQFSEENGGTDHPRAQRRRMSSTASSSSFFSKTGARRAGRSTTKDSTRKKNHQEGASHQGSSVHRLSPTIAPSSPGSPSPSGADSFLWRQKKRAGSVLAASTRGMRLLRRESAVQRQRAQAQARNKNGSSLTSFAPSFRSKKRKKRPILGLSTVSTEILSSPDAGPKLRTGQLEVSQLSQLGDGLAGNQDGSGARNTGGLKLNLLTKMPIVNRLAPSNYKFDRHLVRRLVSQNRKRFVDPTRGYDLDLVYITPRLIAMAHPSRGLEVLYRNSYSQVIKFFEDSHKGHYRIYNLCMKRKYPLTANVEHYGFCDHNACPMTKLLALMEDMDSWIKAHKDNVAIVHCKAGKGRTGLVVSAFLVHSGRFKTAEEAITFFGQTRTKDGRGLTVASQRRYVHYYQEAKDAKDPASQAKTAAAWKAIIQSTNQVLQESINLNERLRLSAGMSPKFVLEKVELVNVPLFLKGSRSSIHLKVLSGVPSGIVPTGKTKTGEFQLKQHSFSQSKNRRVKNVKHKKDSKVFGSGETWTWEPLQKLTSSVSSAGAGVRRIRSEKNVKEEGRLFVQGDFKIVCYSEKINNVINPKPTTRKLKKVFQCWLNTNFLKVNYNDHLIDAYQIDATVMQTLSNPGRISSAGASSFRAGMSSTSLGSVDQMSSVPLSKGPKFAQSADWTSLVKLGKYDLDGVVGKDRKSKYFQDSFCILLRFRIINDQPNIRC